MRTPWSRYFHIGFFPSPELEVLRIPGAPAFMRGVKALFLSDIHLRGCVSDEKLHALIRQIRAAGADLILLGGDYAETDAQCARFFEAFRGVDAPLGVYGVPGNNDDRESLPAYMARAGAILLSNRAVSLHLPGGKLQIGGCDDHKFGSPRTSGLFSDGGYRILISHFPAAPDCAPDLMLSGHTHGGQINFLGLTPYSIGFERAYRLLGAGGLSKFGNSYLAVCNGIGVSRLPLRIGARAQILLVEFGS
ncbi:MAG: metallophosphoesterase family protein [Clostridia bacterium]|nr:metallophosphoesterase family protein [Clostridia bacterium]